MRDPVASDARRAETLCRGTAAWEAEVAGTIAVALTFGAAARDALLAGQERRVTEPRCAIRPEAARRAGLARRALVHAVAEPAPALVVDRTHSAIGTLRSAAFGPAELPFGTSALRAERARRVLARGRRAIDTNANGPDIHIAWIERCRCARARREARQAPIAEDRRARSSLATARASRLTGSSASVRAEELAVSVRDARVVGASREE